MVPNWIGVVAALATFLSVWLGHVSVRALEYRAASLRWPTVMYLTVAALAYFGSLVSPSPVVSGALGILGTTLWFDALELRRQFKRVMKGHAPANPRNPRHVPLIAQGRATTTDWLNRQPTGQQVRSEGR